MNRRTVFHYKHEFENRDSVGLKKWQGDVQISQICLSKLRTVRKLESAFSLLNKKSHETKQSQHLLSSEESL